MYINHTTTHPNFDFSIYFGNEKLDIAKAMPSVEASNFYGDATNRDPERYLLIGFDTEYVGPEQPLTQDEVKDGLARNTVLSYQVYCKVVDPDRPAEEWGGVYYPSEGDRISLKQLLEFAVWSGIQTGTVRSVPRTIYVVGHFTRADLPGLSDIKDLAQTVSVVRNSFVTTDLCTEVSFGSSNEEAQTVKVYFRDTWLLTPAQSKSLLEIGRLVGQEKISIGSDPEIERHYKRHMDELLRDDRDLFERYALNDAIICVRFAEKVIALCGEILGTPKFPITLSSIGADLLWDTWVEEQGLDPLALIGKEKVKDRWWDKKKQRYRYRTLKRPLEEVYWNLDFVTECYHGGRAEQYAFGPSHAFLWADYDLSGAYPTAMSLIGTPDWRGIRETTDINDFTPLVLGFANVEFSFPMSVRFPSLPVRTEHGLVFPRSGRSYCSSPEIALARSLGAKISIRKGIVVPTDKNKPVFAEFIRKCVAKRREFAKGSLEELFWKELTNSTYGKTAQGLREKRVYDARSGETKLLPESKITNPYYAAFITSFVRAVLAEVMNALPEPSEVFSCTTDGFLTNASGAGLAPAGEGELISLYQQARVSLTGDATSLEVKHECGRLLGWRMRGQATLVPGTSDKGESFTYVLAKGGIHTPEYIESVKERNEYIVDLFLNRHPDQVLPIVSKTGIREIFEFDADLVEKVIDRRLGMEYDWKRRPERVSMSGVPDHLYFTTQPWDSVDQFITIRRKWEEYNKEARHCLKTIEDYRQFGTYLLTTTSVDGVRYLRKSAPDLNLLRKMLGAAWYHSEAGLVLKENGLSNGKFADILSSVGIPCKRTDIENDRKRDFIAHQCVRTPVVLEALSRLKEQHFPRLDVDRLLSRTDGGLDILSAIEVTSNVVNDDHTFKQAA